ncbi:MAG: hypothetical protein K8S21_02225 [Gemmatimonadetes bacterium]|nr:hypothetical protein [Gemmatimonadota bacterium]
MNDRTEGPPAYSPVSSPKRAPYLPPRLGRFGVVTTLTATVSMKGLMDNFMGRRTG